VRVKQRKNSDKEMERGEGGGVRVHEGIASAMDTQRDRKLN
jgi:hypothetical protein